MCLFVRVVDHGVNEGEPVDEQCCEPVNEDQLACFAVQKLHMFCLLEKHGWIATP